MSTPLRAAAIAAALTTLAACGPQRPSPTARGDQGNAPRRSIEARTTSTKPDPRPVAPWPDDERAHSLPTGSRLAAGGRLIIPRPQLGDLDTMWRLGNPASGPHGLRFRSAIDVTHGTWAEMDVSDVPALAGTTNLGSFAKDRGRDDPFEIVTIDSVQVAHWPTWSVQPGDGTFPDRRSSAYAFLDRVTGDYLMVIGAGIGDDAVRSYVGELIQR